MILIVLGVCNFHAKLNAQASGKNEKVQKASREVEAGYKKDNKDTLAQGYFNLGEGYYQKGDLPRSEEFFQRSKDLYEQLKDPAGIAKSSRGLAKVQEDQNKEKEALGNYKTAIDNTIKTGDQTSNNLNTNDFRRLTRSDSLPMQESLIERNIKLGMVNKDTSEIVTSFSRMGDLNLQNKKPTVALNAFTNAYNFSRNIPSQASYFNQRITDVYLQQKDFPKAIETKQELLNESFVQNSTQLRANTITSLASIYTLKKEDSTAEKLLKESYAISVLNGHTLEARTSVEKLDSIFRSSGRKELSLKLYKDFLSILPDVIVKDSSIADNRLIAETETRIRELETEKALKDDLIRRKNIFNYWLTGSLAALVIFTVVILLILRKLRIRNKKIALQSLRREMNPHFIFNSLNSINQFIANNNEIEANQYLTKFSKLMRGVMENSKEDFVLFSKEVELLTNYLDLEKSRFPDKFDFVIETDDSLLAEEQLFIPGMLIQPHLENAIWHGLRYMDDKGLLKLRFSRISNSMEIIIEDNGIGLAESKVHKTENQKQHNGRGIKNTQERIKILNELYRQGITCKVEDKLLPDRGVIVTLTVPLLKDKKG